MVRKIYINKWILIYKILKLSWDIKFIKIFLKL